MCECIHPSGISREQYTPDTDQHLTDMGEALAGALRDLAAAPRALQTHARRRVAERIVDARELFTRSDGEPDWTGRTWAYREWVAGVYSDAGYSRDAARREAAATRYHVQSVLREWLDAATLKAYGLLPHDRVVASRMRRARQREELLTLREAVAR